MRSEVALVLIKRPLGNIESSQRQRIFASPQESAIMSFIAVLPYINETARDGEGMR